MTTETQTRTRPRITHVSVGLLNYFAAENRRCDPQPATLGHCLAVLAEMPTDDIVIDARTPDVATKHDVVNLIQEVRNLIALFGNDQIVDDLDSQVRHAPFADIVTEFEATLHDLASDSEPLFEVAYNGGLFNREYITFSLGEGGIDDSTESGRISASELRHQILEAAVDVIRRVKPELLRTEDELLKIG